MYCREIMVAASILVFWTPKVHCNVSLHCKVSGKILGPSLSPCYVIFFFFLFFFFFCGAGSVIACLSFC